MEAVPITETAARMVVLQRRLQPAGIGLALIRQPVHLFYYTGTLVDGLLAVAADREPLLLVRRPQYRLLQSDPPWPLAFYQDLKEVPEILEQAGFDLAGPLGLELDTLTVLQYRRFQERLFPGREVRDLAPLLRFQRMIKSTYEMEQLRQAARVLDQMFQRAPKLLKPGVTELQVAAALEYDLRLRGHQGLVRLRNWNLELFYGHVLSGRSGLQAAYCDTPSGGSGFSPAYPQGAGKKRLTSGEPISIDFCCCINGYVVDQTRMYALGSLPAQALEAFEAIRELYRLVEAAAVPGAQIGDLYRLLTEEVRRRGYEENFMGQGVERVSFIGHGVGLELDEYPVLTSRFPHPLEENMVLAFEPKIFLPGIGMIGMEDTGRITPQGMEWLTITPREITVLGKSWQRGK